MNQKNEEDPVQDTNCICPIYCSTFWLKEDDKIEQKYLIFYEGEKISLQFLKSDSQNKCI